MGAARAVLKLVVLSGNTNQDMVYEISRLRGPSKEDIGMHVTRPRTTELQPFVRVRGFSSFPDIKITESDRFIRWQFRAAVKKQERIMQR